MFVGELLSYLECHIGWHLVHFVFFQMLLGLLFVQTSGSLGEHLPDVLGLSIVWQGAIRHVVLRLWVILLVLLTDVMTIVLILIGAFHHVVTLQDMSKTDRIVVVQLLLLMIVPHSIDRIVSSWVIIHQLSPSLLGWDISLWEGIRVFTQGWVDSIGVLVFRYLIVISEAPNRWMESGVHDFLLGMVGFRYIVESWLLLLVMLLRLEGVLLFQSLNILPLSSCLLVVRVVITAVVSGSLEIMIIRLLMVILRHVVQNIGHALSGFTIPIGVWVWSVVMGVGYYKVVLGVEAAFIGMTWGGTILVAGKVMLLLLLLRRVTTVVHHDHRLVQVLVGHIILRGGTSGSYLIIHHHGVIGCST